MASIQTNTDEPTRPFYTFPPFPTPPQGVTIIPFTAFKEPGIVIQIDADGTDGEVDGRGVPTLMLNSRHDLTLEEKKMGKKRLANATQVTADGSVRRIAWHEEWRSHERAHHFSYDPASSEFDRLWQASWDFKNSRAWPPTTNPLLNLWDQIRLYIGLITSIQPPPSKRKKGGQAPVVQADDDDEDDNEEYVNVKEEVPVERVDDPQEGLKIAQERNKAAAKDTSSKPPLDDAARELMREQPDAKKDQRMQEFLHDTENTIKIFFSAHWRDKGLAWDKARSEQCPLLLGFFLRFLLFVNAFPEPDIQRGLQRALKIAERAEVELPATFVVAKTLEDGVSKGFRQMWGNMTNTLKLWDDEEEEVDVDADVNFPKAQDVTAVEVADTEEVEEAADLDDNSPVNAKKRKLESGQAVLTTTTTTITSTTTTAATTANEEEDKDTIVINSNEMSIDVDLDTAALKDAIADNVDINGVEVAPSDGWEAWGSTWGGTNNTTNDGGEWGDTANGGWGAERSGSPTPVVDDAWKIEEDVTLVRLLGEETVRVFGERYTTGVVERSTRRVVRVVKPSEASSKGKSQAGKGTSQTGSAESESESVESELESKLAHVVLAPWKKVGNHIGSDVTLPVLQSHSRGDEKFDPTKEEIVVLLDPASCEKIPVGVGLTATWVQLARRVGDDEEGEGKKKKGAKGKNGEGTRWWYMEQFMATLASFHTDRYYPDQD